MMMQNLNVTTMGPISSMGSAALSAGQGVTPISVGLHPIQPEGQAIFTQAANDCG
jgi:hypothetical protein